MFVLQACCKACGRVFRPLNDVLGLPFTRRFLDELVEKGIKLGTQFSFARSANAIRELTSGSISAEGIRQKIAERARSIEMPDDVSALRLNVRAVHLTIGPSRRKTLFCSSWDLGASGAAELGAEACVLMAGADCCAAAR